MWTLAKNPWLQNSVFSSFTFESGWPIYVREGNVSKLFEQVCNWKDLVRVLCDSVLKCKCLSTYSKLSEIKILPKDRVASTVVWLLGDMLVKILSLLFHSLFCHAFLFVQLGYIWYLTFKKDTSVLQSSDLLFLGLSLCVNVCLSEWKLLKQVWRSLWQIWLCVQKVSNQKADSV